MYEAKALICFTFGLLLVVLVWRFWKFSLKPAFHPEDPKELPYWIPCEYRTNFPVTPTALTDICSCWFVEILYSEVELPKTDEGRRNLQMIGHAIGFSRNSFSLLQNAR